MMPHLDLSRNRSS